MPKARYVSKAEINLILQSHLKYQMLEEFCIQQTATLYALDLITAEELDSHSLAVRERIKNDKRY